jgi:hypothetical protein
MQLASCSFQGEIVPPVLQRHAGVRTTMPEPKPIYVGLDIGDHIALAVGAHIYTVPLLGGIGMGIRLGPLPELTGAGGA